MTFIQNIMSKIGFIKSEDSDVCGQDVIIRDGQAIGHSYADFLGAGTETLRNNQLNAAYDKISCVGSSIDLISRNMQMIEPVFYNNSNRDVIEFPDDKKLKNLKRILEKPNSLMNRKQFIDVCVKEYIVQGCICFAFVLDGRNILSIKPLNFNNITYFVDIENDKIDHYLVNNSGIYSGEYVFDGRYYKNIENKNIILAPLINPSTEQFYIPSSLLQGTGTEILLYWYGCVHNKSLLQNGARPSLIFLIKSMLNPKHREQLRDEIKLRHGGARNAGSAMIIDGSAEKEIRTVSQNNKDMEFTSVLKAAEDAIYKKLGVNWVLGKDVTSKDLPKCMELLYDMTICPMFQLFYNHIFDVFKYYNEGFGDFVIFYLEQDIPALRPRFLSMMKDMPGLGIFTVKERRKMYNYAPLGDYRDDELTVQSVKVTQTGAEGQNTTSFTKDEQ